MHTSFRINHQMLQRKVSLRLQQADLSAERADIEAQLMVAADLAEVPSHGIKMLPKLIAALDDGRINAKPSETITSQFAAVSILDCDYGSGRAAALRAMQRAVAQAQTCGIGLCLAKNTSHWGRAHAYATYAAREGCIGICSTNAIPSMAAWQARTKVFGNNPLAIGVPAPTLAEPCVIDMAMSQASVGKVATLLQQGTKVPDGLGFDAAGNPSSDAQQLLAGALAAFGGHKGEGLSLMLEMLSAGLTGGDFTHQLQQKDQSGIDGGSSKFFIAINVAAFLPIDEYQRRICELFDHLNTTAPAFQYPGARGWKCHQANLKLGVPLHPELLQQLQAIGITLN
ncbi:Ldh family oxidoreductase [Gilvimarinus sp. SDUM040013]|uniref:Ldh family oxidoreductase n=1 Tax=Gilvimarinus gilvus TaxID=3058038 RepID=A0ABU4S1V1_9GAMM|nr:Ldh family oxidoreductase [Gilvimarinus sp. SDUM040013]MDO3385452.1 Ldh family oxidoreductase [Gilvimarinus sp. SDUM040013]MDX6851131.1 Ldh family oxidoreductase [Gilvimarinus sp. SDUM040013]